jgi:hypothetical protein
VVQGAAGDETEPARRRHTRAAEDEEVGVEPLTDHLVWADAEQARLDGEARNRVDGRSDGRLEQTAGVVHRSVEPDAALGEGGGHAVGYDQFGPHVQGDGRSVDQYRCVVGQGLHGRNDPAWAGPDGRGPGHGEDGPAPARRGRGDLGDLADRLGRGREVALRGHRQVLPA